MMAPDASDDCYERIVTGILVTFPDGGKPAGWLRRKVTAAPN
jgi:hypothetical protein